MKKRALSICLFFIACLSTASAQDVGIAWQNWSTGTAHLLPENRAEIGAFQPLRYGYSESLEFSAHPVLFFIMPNFSVKWAHHPIGGFAVASQHGLSHPSPMLRLVGRPGIGGLISPEFPIPAILSFQNELLLSRTIRGTHLFTASLALNFALKSGPLDPRTTIDLPIVYNRSSVYYNDYGFKLGTDIKGKLAGRWMYLLNGDWYYYPKAPVNINMAFEQKGLLFWNRSAGFQLCAGYVLSYCEYPFGGQWHLLPLLDVQWAWPR
ncbi:hypothetical protein JXA02_05115 [candidate division KSB1 bacterium]|nr:hypothetical protein [candidate division KSB1 bacterium]RQW08250.1 MAG: hypothetical protein EH222_05885 [candidate division KSB1 bacterium]